MKKLLPTKFTIPTIFLPSVNSIFILDFLSDDDKQTGLHGHEFLRDKLIQDKHIFNASEQTIYRTKCSNLEDIKDVFQSILYLSEQLNKPDVHVPFVPLIIIHAHGDKKLGLQLPNQEFLSWTDLVKYAKAIMQITNGNFSLMLFACYSNEFFHEFIKLRDIERKKLFDNSDSLTEQNIQNTSNIYDYWSRFPCSSFFGYENKVQAQTVEKEFQVIIDKIFNHQFTENDIKNIEMNVITESNYVADEIHNYINWVNHILNSEKLDKIPNIDNILPMLKEIIKDDNHNLIEQIEIVNNLFKELRRNRIKNRTNFFIITLNNLIVHNMYDTKLRQRVVNSILTQLFTKYKLINQYITED